MKILVINAYVREQGGDAALLSVIISQLVLAYPHAKIAIAGMEGPTDWPDFDGVPNIGSIRHYTSIESLGTVHRLARRLLSFAIGWVWFMGPRPVWRMLRNLLPKEVQAELAAIEQADVLVGVGGGYLNGKDNRGGNWNVYYLMLPVRLANRLGKPVIFAPQSYGVFGNAKQENWAKTMLASDLIMVREQPSVTILEHLGFPKEKLYKTVDSGFAFTVPAQPDVMRQFGVPQDKPLVGVTAKRYLDPAPQAAFEKELAASIDYIQGNYGFRVVLLPQVTAAYQGDDDRVVAKRIAAHCNPANPPVVIDAVITHHTLKAMYGHLDYLIGTRFHSVIFGLTSRVPSIAIAYEHKTNGIMHDLELDKWVIAMPDVTKQKMNVLFDTLVAERPTYLAHLAKVLPPYVVQANSTPSLIRRVLAKRGISAAATTAAPGR